MANVRHTTQEQITLLEARLKKLKDKLKAPAMTLDKDSAGMDEAIAALKALSTAHNVTLGEVIKAVSRIKRTGLRISDPAPKVRKKKVLESVV